MTAASSKDFRNALGQFATGVTIVTATDTNGAPVGVTASSFNSVSLDPPLVLWSLARTSRSMAAFETAGGFNVHVLASHQTDLSNHFARSTADKFNDLPYSQCQNGFPVLPEFAALYRCETQYQYDGGDHVIFVGRVVDFQTNDLPVLVFHAGRYAGTQLKASDTHTAKAGQPNAWEFTEDFLLHLVSRAHFISSAPNRHRCAEEGLSETAFFCLSLLSMSGELSEEEASLRLTRTGHLIEPDMYDQLRDKGWILGDSTAIRLSDSGRALFIDLIAHHKALEEHLSKQFTEDEWDAAHAFLKKFIRITGADLSQPT